MEKWILCYTCHNTLSSKKVIPKLSRSNGLQVDPIPPELEELNDLEVQLLAKNLIFMKIFRIPAKSNYLGLKMMKNRIINIPLEDQDIERTFNILPRNMDESGLAFVNFKTMKKLKKKVLSKWVRIKEIFAALRVLIAENPHYADVKINENWNFGEYEQDEDGVEADEVQNEQDEDGVGADEEQNECSENLAKDDSNMNLDEASINNQNVIDGKICDNCGLSIPYLYLNEHLIQCLLDCDEQTKQSSEVCCFKNSNYPFLNGFFIKFL